MIQLSTGKEMTESDPIITIYNIVEDDHMQPPSPDYDDYSTSSHAINTPGDAYLIIIVLL